VNKSIVREQNSIYYRLAHWPIWIFVCFLADGRLTFHLIARGFDRQMLRRLAAVLAGTGAAVLVGKLPGGEPRPYILRFTEDRPNPLYRRFYYTLAWSELVAYTLLNIVGIIGALIRGRWQFQSVYHRGYFPIAGTIWALGVLRLLPRVKSSTKGEADERRYFYGAVWSVGCAQGVLGVMWKLLPLTRRGTLTKLVGFLGVLGFLGGLAVRGILPRTQRTLVPGSS
jgi:hypothetical protein